MAGIPLVRLVVLAVLLIMLNLIISDMPGVDINGANPD